MRMPEPTNKWEEHKGKIKRSEARYVLQKLLIRFTMLGYSRNTAPLQALQTSSMMLEIRQQLVIIRIRHDLTQWARSSHFLSTSSCFLCRLWLWSSPSHRLCTVLFSSGRTWPWLVSRYARGFSLHAGMRLESVVDG